MMNNAMVLGFPEYQLQAQQLAYRLNCAYADIRLHHFPDGESQLTLPASLPEHVILCRSLNAPNDKLVELVLAAASARKHGVDKLSLVAPYLCYMRQDIAFHPGEVVSQKIIGELLGQYFDQVLTVDAHLHRIATLSEAIPSGQAVNISATDPMAQFLELQLNQPFLIGPDMESEQWVAAIASHYNMDYRIARKQRFGDKSVQVTLPQAHYQGRHIVIVDDVASTGKTLLAVAEQLRDYHPASVSVLVTHAMFVDDAVQQLTAANVSNIWSCNTIVHPTNRIDLAQTLADALQKMQETSLF